MNINVKILKQALAKVYPVIASNPIIPVLGSFKVDVKSTEVVITGTDTERTVSTYIEMSNIDTYNICIPASIFYDTVKSLPDGDDLEFVYDGKSNLLNLKTRTGKFKISLDDVNDFPVKEVSDIENLFEISSNCLSMAISKTSFCVSKDTIRLAMTGVCLQVSKKEGVSFTATDAHSLAHVSFDIKPKAEKTVIIPGKALNHLNNIIDNDVPVSIGLLGENKVIFYNNTFSYSILLVDAKYPDYRSVIPGAGDVVSVATKELASSVKRVALFSNTATRQIVFTIQESAFKVSGTDIDFGRDATEELVCDSTLDNFIIGVDHNYMSEILKRVEGDNTIFNFSGPTRTITISEDRENIKTLFLIIPLMVV